MLSANRTAASYLTDMWTSLNEQPSHRVSISLTINLGLRVEQIQEMLSGLRTMQKVE